MSLSKYFKDNGSFTPKSLVSGSQKQTGDWMPAAVPGDEQSVPLPGKDIPETVHQNVESSEEQLAEAVVTPDSSDQKEKTDDIALDTGTQKPAAEIPDIEELQKEAYDAGLKQGLKQAQADFGSAQTALTLLCDQLSTIRETILKNS
ncbi:MAG: hypothetical protein V2I35_01875, partial [Desulfocapsaceae bacterium]|nr:hypothetical protein [Desulfocapsaceae bacterium]